MATFVRPTDQSRPALLVHTVRRLCASLHLGRAARRSAKAEAAETDAVALDALQLSLRPADSIVTLWWMR
jgi:hypothetical protein